MDKESEYFKKQQIIDLENSIRSFERPKETQTTAIWSLINILNTPIAKRSGVRIPAEDCQEWVKILTEECKKYNIPETEPV